MTFEEIKQAAARALAKKKDVGAVSVRDVFIIPGPRREDTLTFVFETETNALYTWGVVLPFGYYPNKDYRRAAAQAVNAVVRAMNVQREEETQTESNDDSTGND